MSDMTCRGVAQAPEVRSLRTEWARSLPNRIGEIESRLSANSQNTRAENDKTNTAFTT
jgi:hypothetical protein